MIFVDSFGLVEVAILLVTAIVGVIYWVFIYPLSYWSRKGITNVPGVPLFGSLLDAITLKATIGELYANVYHKEKGKRYIGFVKFNKPGILIRDPELIKNVLLRDFNNFHDNDISVDPHLDPLMARNIFVVAGESWKKIRAGVTPAFTSGKIKSIFPLIHEVCEELKTYIKEQVEASDEKGWEVEMKDMAARYTTEVVSSSAFGLQCGSIRNPDCEFRRMGRKVLEPSPMKALVQLLVLMQPSVSKLLRLRFFSADITEFFRGIVKEVVSKRESTGTKRNDFLNMLVQLSKTGKLGLEQEGRDNEEAAEPKNGEVTKTVWTQTRLDDVAAQAVGFFLDGFETSSTTLGFFILEMAHNPEIQERLRNEVKETIERHGGTLTYDGISEMNYMEMVFQETLRKYPPALSITRICTKRYHLPSIENDLEDDTKNGVLIEEGMPVVVPVYGLHHDPNYYPDPDKFDPERFTEENKRNRHRFVYLPIGEGPRICIGIRLGYAQTKAAIATILENYEVLPNERTKLPITIDPNSFLISSKDKLWVRLRRLK